MKKYLTLRNSLIALSILLFLIAWNRGITLLYGMFALVVAVLIVSLIAPRLTLSKLSAKRICDTALSEGDLLSIEVTLLNSGWFTRYLVELVQPMPGLSDENSIIALVPSIKGRQKLTQKIPCELRGLHYLPPLLARSGFPLGINEATKFICETKEEVLVYPSPFFIHDFPYVSGAHIPVAGVQAISRRGGSQEFIEVREYQSGDSPRHIHWPQTARQNTLMVREHEFLAATEVTVLLNLHHESEIGEGKESTLEYAVKIAASIANHACTAGHRVRLIGYGENEVNITSGTGIAHYEAILATLALVRADGNKSYADAIQHAIAKVAHGSVMVIFDSQSDSTQQFEPPEFYARHIKPVWIRFDKKSFLNPVQINRINAFEQMGDIPVYNIRCGDDLATVFGAYK